MAKGWSSAQTPQRGGRESVSVMKGEVDSSILSGSTIQHHGIHSIPQPQAALSMLLDACCAASVVVAGTVP